MRTTPYEHQLVAYEASKNQPFWAYLMEMGTGKSKVLIDNFCYLWLKERITGVLILAPKGVYHNWLTKEIPAHGWVDVPRNVVLWSNSRSKTYQRELETLIPGKTKELQILVMNIEALSQSKHAYEFAMRFLAKHDAMCAVDESTTIKNPGAKRTKLAMLLRDVALYRRVLTGSPVTRSPLDLWGQMEFLKRGVLGFKSHFAFRRRYAIMEQMEYGGRKFWADVGYHNIDELNARIQPFSSIATKDECLDLPAKVYETRDVELTPEQTRLYDGIADHATAELNDGMHVTATEVIVQILRLHQVVCGHVVDETGGMHDVENRRIATLMDVLEEAPDKVIIWASYRHSIQKIAQTIEKTYEMQSVVEYHGGTNQADRERAIERFQNDPKCRFFVGTQAAGGYGITLTTARTVVYYSNSYDLEKRVQSEDRAHRIGQHWPVTYVDLVARDTVDEKILSALRRKIDIASTVMGRREMLDWVVPSRKKR